MDKNTQLLIVLASALVLNYIPVVGKFIKGFNTLIHESAHAFMALITSGEVMSVNLFYGGEGLASTKSGNLFGKFLVSIAGYFCSSAVGYILFFLVKKDYHEYILYGFIALGSINLLFWVRNLYGVSWLLFMIMGLGSIFYFQQKILGHYIALFIASVVAVDALVSSGIIFFLSIKTAAKAGDAYNLKLLTYIPTFVWGLIFFIQAIGFALLTIRLFLPLSFDVLI